VGSAEQGVESGKWKVEARTARQVLSCEQESAKPSSGFELLIWAVSFHFELFTLNYALEFMSHPFILSCLRDENRQFFRCLHLAQTREMESGDNLHDFRVALTGPILQVV
jgi:hypothetical protein